MLTRGVKESKKHGTPVQGYRPREPLSDILVKSRIQAHEED
jgi:hypothetical protein